MNPYGDLTIGVLALQGGWRPHADVLSRLGVAVRYVRCVHDLDGIHGIVLPGGESTAIAAALGSARLWQPLRRAIRDHGLPVLGTCAGAILLAGELGGGSCTIERNAYGPQSESFSSMVALNGIGQVDGLFIRAPKVVDEGSCTVIARGRDGEAVLLRERQMVLCTFHPELTTDAVHTWFVTAIWAAALAASGDGSAR